MIGRTLAPKLRALAKEFPVIVLTGPRQSGKTTLAKAEFSAYAYISLENLDAREFAVNDPRGFLAQYHGRVIIDEAQRAPDLLSYLQTAVDDDASPGRFILTGSQQFQLLAKVGQSLAGRAAYLRLLPFSLSELRQAPAQDPGGYHGPPPRGAAPRSLQLDDILFQGLYPRIHDRKLAAPDFLAAYITAYIERDVRGVLRVGDLLTFQRFVQLCAGRSGQLLNFSGLASDCGISHTTAREWLSVLEASSIVHLLQPFHKNFSKRIVKSPKLYFIDTGLMCHLLRIRKATELTGHPLYGGVFETFVVSEILKAFVHRGERPALYFWRDQTGHEVDVLLDLGTKTTAIEIKAGRTITSDALSTLDYFSQLKDSRAKSVLICGANESMLRQGVRVRTWWQAS